MALGENTARVDEGDKPDKPDDKDAEQLAPARGKPAENLARDPAIVAKVKAELVPLLGRVRSDRARLRDKWLRYYRIWSLTHDQQGYRGRTNVFFPLGRRWIEQWVSRLNRDCFPDSEWFACRALRENFEERVPAKMALMKYWMRRHMRLRRHALPWLRQLVMYGSSPVRNVWRVSRARANRVARRARRRRRAVGPNEVEAVEKRRRLPRADLRARRPLCVLRVADDVAQLSTTRR